MFPFAQKNRNVLTGTEKFQSGFTLIELIAVIVILSVLVSIGTGFVVKTTESYQRTQTRALLVNTSRQALERMTRQLRNALPYSVRMTNANSCIEFMPIVAAGNYFNPVPDQTNLAEPRAVIPTSPLDVNFGNPRFVTIGAMAANEIYGATASSRAGYAGGSINLTAAKRWQRNSINKRFYLLDNPQAFCVVGNELRFYEDLNVNDSGVTLTGDSSIIARNIAAGSPFSLSAGSENRGTLVAIALDFSSGGETINFTQQVSIRNAP